MVYFAQSYVKACILTNENRTKTLLLQWLSLRLENLAQASDHLAQASQSRLGESLTVAK